MKTDLKLDKHIVINESKNIGLVLLGALILSTGYALFIVPHKLVPGGVFGLSIVINDVIDISIGMMALFINIPLLLWGTQVLGPKTVLRTAVFMIASSFLIDGILFLTNGAVIINDILVSAIFGGLLVGASVFIVKGGGATTGGNDILSRIISSKTNLVYEQLILIIDASIIVLGILVFNDFTLAAYCLITIVTSSKTLGHYLKQNDKKKTVLIFSKNNDQIELELISGGKLKEDAVHLIHKDSSEKMILVAKNNKQLAVIEQLVYQTDPQAHVVSLESNMRLIG